MQSITLQIDFTALAGGEPCTVSVPNQISSQQGQSAGRQSIGFVDTNTQVQPQTRKPQSTVSARHEMFAPSQLDRDFNPFAVGQSTSSQVPQRGHAQARSIQQSRPQQGPHNQAFPSPSSSKEKLQPLPLRNVDEDGSVECSLYDTVQTPGRPRAVSMEEACALLRQHKVGFSRLTAYHLKIGNLNFFPTSGKITIDGMLPIQEQGIDAVIQFVTRGRK